LLDAFSRAPAEIAILPAEPPTAARPGVLRHALDESRATLGRLAVSEPDQSVRLAAIEAIATAGDADVMKSLAAEFASQTPAIRRAILDAMLSNESRAGLLLDEIEAGHIRASELDPFRWERLTKHKSEEIRKRAAKLFDASLPADRRKVLADYQQALTLSADAQRGREVFVKNCTGCHRIGELGVNVAPDIADSRTQLPSQLLTSILDPNRAVDNNYFSYSVVMTDGKLHTGIVASETSSSITLRQQENKTLELLRRAIEEMRSNVS
jgi:putative heme-binding domain-containing protein